MYSGKQVIKAGETLIIPNLEQSDMELFSKSMDILSFWRFTFESSLDTAFRCLENAVIVHDKNAIFAKRLKRFPSIVSKLRRFETMKLKNMQDIGGCRAIVKDEKKLRKVVKELKKLSEFRDSNGVYKFKDYIKHPKEDGYRSYHLIGQFKGSKAEIKSIEIQIRTQIQHFWATALEIVDLFTGQALKSNLGKSEWKDFFSSASEQFALIESIPLYLSLKADDLLEKYSQKLGSSNFDIVYGHKVCKFYIKHLDIVNLFEAFAGSLKGIDELLKELDAKAGFVLLEINTIEKTVRSIIFSNEEGGKKEAEKEYLEAEKAATYDVGRIVALVSSSNIENIKEAYPNYFADSSNFIKYLSIINRINNPTKLNMKKRRKLAVEL